MYCAAPKITTVLWYRYLLILGQSSYLSGLQYCIPQFVFQYF
jgi:hypothetical protein